MQKSHSLIYRWLYPLLLPLLMSLCSSCTVLQMQAFPAPANHTQAFAEQLFINGDFENAILEYEQIYDTALSPEDKNNALYGLACTQMMLARTEEQLVEAISNLQKWDANKGTAPFTENRHLLLLSLKQQSGLILEKKTALIERENLQNSLIANQQIKILQMTSTIESLQNQIKKLGNQIEELEAIDENVQKQKKPL
jgi:hypothetical protein